MNNKITADTALARANRAQKKYGPYASPHEFLGVLIEEVREIEAAIHENNWGDARNEANDIAAVCLKFVCETTTREIAGKY